LKKRPLKALTLELKSLESGKLRALFHGNNFDLEGNLLSVYPKQASKFFEFREFLPGEFLHSLKFHKTMMEPKSFLEIF